VIASVNDASALGAIQALVSAGYAPDSIDVFGLNGDNQARQYIRDGFFMRGTVAIDQTALAETLIHVAAKLLGGGTLPESVTVPPGDLIARATTESTPES
jgi:ABC-type sugar transport system substrate-binding protein